MASLAIFAGGILALEYSRTRDLSAIGLRGLLAANLACLMMASVARTLFLKDSILFAG